MSKENNREAVRQRVASSVIPDDPRANLDEYQAAKRLGVSVHKLRRDRWAGGGVPFLKIGGRIVYRSGDIDAYETSRIRKSTSDHGATDHAA
jgi:hypothetical protein